MRRERMFLVFIKSSSAGGIGDCEKTANSFWMKFGYVVENGRKWGCRQSLSKIVQTDFESGAYKVGKSRFFLFLALIFFWKFTVKPHWDSGPWNFAWICVLRISNSRNKPHLKIRKNKNYKKFWKKSFRRFWRFFAGFPALTRKLSFGSKIWVTVLDSSTQDLSKWS